MQMDDFIFRGRDISEFDASAAFGESCRVGAKIRRSEYELSGGGSVEIGEAVYQTTTRQVHITPVDGREATPEWARAILAWLQGGRGELTLHSDPDTYRIAQFDADGTLNSRDWPTGCLTLTMTMQPIAYATLISGQTVRTSGKKASLTLAMPGSLSAPLAITLTGVSGTITAAEIACRGRKLALAGLKLTSGQSVAYSAGDRYAGVPAALRVNGALTFAPVKRWAQLAGASGDAVTVTLTGGEADVSITTRGRWPA